jgi:hypothetical protein
MRLMRLGILATCFAAAALASAEPARVAPQPTPAPSPAPSRPDGASAIDAGALFAKVVEGLGGKERIGKIRDVRTRGQVTAQTPSGEMTVEMVTTIAFPDRLSQQVDAPFGRFAMVATPSAAFVVGEQGAQDLPTTMRDELLRQVQRGAFYLAQKADDPKLVVRAAGEEKVGEVRAQILDVSYPGVAVRWFVDPATGRILRSAHDATSPEGKAVRIVSDYSDFRTDDGVTLPRRLDVATDGSPDQKLVLDEVKINVGADPKLFERPPAPTPPPTPRPTAPPNGG